MSAKSHCTENQRQVIKRLQAGIDSLKMAITQLMVSEQERKTMDALLMRNQAALDGIKGPYLEDLIQQRAELSRIRKVKQQERKLKREQEHKVSGYTEYVRRAPGSYGAGKN